MNKTPHVTQSENLPPWEWKRERAPVNLNPGPALNVAVNTSDPYPCFEDGVDTALIQVGCLENSSLSMAPAAMSQPVLPLKQAAVLEDGKETASTENRCVENVPTHLLPHHGTLDVIRQEKGLVLENVKMVKALA